MTVRIYTSKNCVPCHEVTKLIKEGKFSGESEVELVDIETDEGFDLFRKEVLDFGDGAVPTAYLEGKKCLITVEEDQVFINCSKDAPPSSG